MDELTKKSMLSDLLSGQRDSIARLRDSSPRVHCITNLAANNFTANVLLALGAIPSLTSSPEEVPDFVARSNVMLINLGTLDMGRKDAIRTGIEVAAEYGKPWVLDPAFANASSTRLIFAIQLLKLRPLVIRANQVEIGALCDGVDVTGTARDLALATGSSVAATGETDIVTNGVLDFTLTGGHPIMAQVTAVGCVTSAIVAAMLTVEPDPLKATLLALTIASVAGEKAASRARGPGSFHFEFLDALYEIDDAALREGAKIS